MKQFLKRYLPPSLLDRLAKMRYTEKHSPYRGMPHDAVFQRIYEQQHWGKEQTVSGAGSTREQTGKIIPEIAAFIHDYKITSILDLPCGDFNWMQGLNLANVQYIGGDIVEDLIAENTKSMEAILSPSNTWIYSQIHFLPAT